jgi:hypothetical protein
MEVWRGVVDDILSNFMFCQKLDDEVLKGTTDTLIHEPWGSLTTEETFAALENALRTDATLNEAIGTPHSERAIREFLRNVLTGMNALRPWPEPAHRPLPPSTRDDFAEDPIARIGMSYAHVGALMGDVFKPAGDHQVLVWHLRSGAELAFVGPWWPGSVDVAVFLRDSRFSPEQVISELVDITRLEWEDVALSPAVPDPEAADHERAPDEAAAKEAKESTESTDTDLPLTDQWVFLIDPAWQPTEESDEPSPEAVVGGWYADSNGEQGRFLPNPAYEPSEPGLPTDPVDVALQLVVSGKADGDELLQATREVILGVAVDDEGYAVVAPAPDGVPSALVATAPRHRERVNAPGWVEVTVEDLAAGLPDEGVDVLLNPGAPASMRLIAGVLKDFLARGETTAARPPRIPVTFPRTPRNPATSPLPTRTSGRQRTSGSQRRP